MPFIISDIGEDFPDNLIIETSNMVENTKNIHRGYHGQGISTQFCDRFPMVTRNGKYLFFVTSHSNHFPSTHTHFYWVDAKIIEELKEE
jgi:hypothetical protein